MKPVRLELWERELESGLAAGSQTHSGVTPKWRVLCLHEVGSTMDIARAQHGDVTPDGPLIVLAQEQSQGRGRQGRVWHQTGAGFAGTFVLATEQPAAALGALSLAVGVGIAEGLGTIGADVRLKWPNDLYSLDGKKLGGILIELVPSPDYTVALIGVGINLVHAPRQFQTSHLYEGTSLRELTGKELHPVECAIALVPHITASWILLLRNGFQAFRNQWRERAMFIGRRITVDTGREHLTGKLFDVSERGGLMLETEDGPREIVSGHLLDIGR